MSFFAYFKRAMRKLSPNEMAAAELAEAELRLLESETGREYADAMVAYNTKRVARLKKFLATANADTEAANAAAHPRPGQTKEAG